MYQEKFANYEKSFSLNIEDLAERIRYEAETAVFAMDRLFNNSNGSKNDPKAFEAKFQKAIALYSLEYVNTIISAPLYLTHNESIRDFVDPQKSLIEGFGLCMQISSAFVSLVERNNLPVRLVQLLMEDANSPMASHVAAEVKIGNQWRYFCPSYSAIAVSKGNNLDILSVERLAKGEKFDVIQNNIDPWVNEWHREFGNPIVEIFRDKRLSVIYDGAGVCLIPLSGQIYDFKAKFNHIGANKLFANRQGMIELEFSVPKGANFSIEFANQFSGEGSGELLISINQKPYRKIELSKLGSMLEIGKSGKIRLALSNQAIGPLVISSARLS